MIDRSNVTVQVTFILRDENGTAVHTLTDLESGVRLNDDSVQASAANLAYGLVEDSWGVISDEEDED